MLRGITGANIIRRQRLALIADWEGVDRARR